MSSTKKQYTAAQVRLDITFAMIERRGLQFLLPKQYIDVYREWLKAPLIYRERIQKLARQQDEHSVMQNGEDQVSLKRDAQ